jgi:hypothetical protein
MILHANGYLLDASYLELSIRYQFADIINYLASFTVHCYLVRLLLLRAGALLRTF